MMRKGYIIYYNVIPHTSSHVSLSLPLPKTMSKGSRMPMRTRPRLHGRVGWTPARRVCRWSSFSGMCRLYFPLPSAPVSFACLWIHPAPWAGFVIQGLLRERRRLVFVADFNGMSFILLLLLKYSLLHRLQHPFAAGAVDIHREQLYTDAFEQLEMTGSNFRGRVRVTLYKDVSHRSEIKASISESMSI